ncbi:MULTISPECIES: MBL fold metallo-hydrolase [Microbacterium]|uniref:Glyoxylase, beta-lactamase superfamily II n=1 Tax=Microbacterium saccharophilum TaxID=1213358 RepID=A0A7Z7GDL0_9MICO|nr:MULTISPECIES: MBL fold metallo-hydrolase [Microbacterium]SFI61332.1 Glyoxylase, beta-lactamase superfamily II [Microbacterium saccharophilum]
MQIGSMKITPLLDGEILAEPSGYYTNVDDEDWEPHSHLLDECTGKLAVTVGGHLVRHGNRVIVVDTGNGPQPVFPFVGGAFRSALAAAHVKPHEVTDVIFTHLHLDHIGWASLDGKPFFPNATYRVDRRDWDFFMDPDYDMPDWEEQLSVPSRDAAAVRLAPIADRIEFFEGDDEVLPGIHSIEAAGHTPGSAVLELVSDRERGVLIGDLVHAQPELIAEKGWDFFAHVDPKVGLDSTRRISKWLADEKLPFAGAHFTGMTWWRIDTADGRRTLTELPE